MNSTESMCISSCSVPSFLNSSRILRGCDVANSLPLVDAQGYINGNTAAYPVAFFDIHIGTPSGAAQLVREIEAWGTLP
jgi:hypothetical protein